MDSKIPKPKIKSQTFKYKNFDCYEYIKDMSNFSDYICDLIRLDMEHGLIRKVYNLPQSQVESNYKLVVESTSSKVKPEENKNKPEKVEPKIEISSEEVFSNCDDYLDF